MYKNIADETFAELLTPALSRSVKSRDVSQRSAVRGRSLQKVSCLGIVRGIGTKVEEVKRNVLIADNACSSQSLRCSGSECRICIVYRAKSDNSTLDEISKMRLGDNGRPVV